MSEKKEISSVLYINSLLDRRIDDPITSNEFVSFLNTPIRSYSGKISVKLLSIELPSIFNTFSESSSLFWYRNLTTNTNNFVQIPTNRYYVDGGQFANVMNQDLSANNEPIRFTYDANSATLLVQNVGSDNLRLISSYIYQDQNIYNDAMLKLGFINDYTTQVIAPNAYYQAESPLRLIRTNCAYLTCNLIASSAVNTTIVPSPYVAPQQILGKVGIGNFGILSQLQFTSEISFNIGSSTISDIKWGLLDENYEPLATLSHPVTFSVQIKYE